ncbi:N-acetylglucosaminyl-phosphatidylinositol de-N-acetylase [Cryptotrichosporon argae]
MLRLKHAALALAAAAVAIIAVSDPVAVSAASAARLRQHLRGDATGAPSALLVTAHPDDEVMFFSPTVLGLAAEGWHLSAVCLSNGNGDGLGEVRQKELYASYGVLGLWPDDITLVEHPCVIMCAPTKLQTVDQSIMPQPGDTDDSELQDGMANAWEPSLVANVLSPLLTARPVDYMITFDVGGITGHANHIPLAFAHAYLPPAGLAPRPRTGRPRLLVLRSPGRLAKFTGPAWALLRLVWHRLARAADALLTLPGYTGPADALNSAEGDVLVFTATWDQYRTAWRAMLRHQSQLVWFRWLYMLFSRLVWVNEIVYVGP